MEASQAKTSTAPGVLRRELGLTGAVATGLGSILGAGVFVSLGVAAGVAGPWVLLAIVLAGGLAVCNALSSAQLAATHPVSGGTYEYGYAYLGPTCGFGAGWMFLLAKSASAATAALGCAFYLLRGFLGVESGWATPLALGLCAAATGVVLCGVRRSGWVNLAIVGLTLLSLVAFSTAGLWWVAQHGSAGLAGVQGVGSEASEHWRGAGVAPGLFEATALMFVAYTGYGRIATLGEEVRDPRRTIPRAIVITLAVSGGLYLLVGWAAIASVGAARLAAGVEDGGALLQSISAGYGWPGLPWLVGAGAVAATLGVLLNLILGLSRVVLAMGRRRDLPGGLSKLDGRGEPRGAVVLVGVLVAGLAAMGSIQTAWSLSAFAVLLYYAVTNLAALRLPPDQRLYSPWFARAGLAGCLFLAFWVPLGVWLAGLGALAVGLAWHAGRRALARRG
ncbi:MAG: APC family permease [Planctomycetota bacterium]